MRSVDEPVRGRRKAGLRFEDETRRLGRRERRRGEKGREEQGLPDDGFSRTAVDRLPPPGFRNETASR
jgi:hypothetical protein